MSADDAAGIRAGSWVKMVELLFQKGSPARSLEHLAWAFFEEFVRQFGAAGGEHDLRDPKTFGLRPAPDIPKDKVKASPAVVASKLMAQISARGFEPDCKVKKHNGDDTAYFIHKLTPARVSLIETAPSDSSGSVVHVPLDAFLDGYKLHAKPDNSKAQDI